MDKTYFINRTIQGDINSKLREAYIAFWQQYEKEIMDLSIQGYPIASPYFITINQDEYSKSSLKGMIIAKDSNQWGTELSKEDRSVDNLMKLYDSFVVDQWGDESIYWRFISDLREWSRELLYNEVYFAVTNVSKIGKQGIGTDKEVFDYVTNKTNLVLEEYKLIKPDFLIVLNQAKEYNYYIQKTFGDFEIEETEVPRITRLLFSEISTPCLRVDHPIYLACTKRREIVLSIIKDFVLEIKNNKK